MLNPRKLRQRGQVIVVTAISAIALFGVLALAFDGGRVLMDQRAMQNALDGAALTGALDIGPGTATKYSYIAQDNSIYALETALGVDFSNNYNTSEEHYLNPGSGANCGGKACDPPYNATCCSWTDSTGAYKLTVTTPYNFNGSDNEAYIHMDLVHNLPLMIGGSIFPTLAVHVQTTARNYALPYSLYTLKYYDPNDYYINGNASLTANQKMGTNGGSSHVGTSSIGFTCLGLDSGGFGYGGDLYEYVPSGSGILDATSFHQGTCTAVGVGVPPPTDNSISLQQPPPLHLPPDPIGAASCGSAGTCVSVTISGSQTIPPTISADPTKGPGPRYGSVNVGSGATLYLQPGVYFFEGTAASSGLNLTNGTAAVVTQDCYGYMPLPTPAKCWPHTSSSGPMCPSGFGPGKTGVTVTAAYGATVPFSCYSPDMGTLLVFYAAGSDQSPNPSNCTGYNPSTQPSQRYCTKTTNTSGSNNQLSVFAGSTIFTTSSPRYHNVAVYVDPTNAQSPNNFTTTSDLSAAGCSGSPPQPCADQIGLGSHAVIMQGGGSISINGAIYAPTDNVQVGGGGNGQGYGQIISYTLSTIGNGIVAEKYNPLALAYSPVIVQ